MIHLQSRERAMSAGDVDELAMFSRKWYNEFFRRATFSAAHSEFCEKIYGKDLCQHGLMHMRELGFLAALIEPHSEVLDLGCGNGLISEYLHDRTASSVLGLDYSDIAIGQAQRRTHAKAGTLRFQCMDLTQNVIPGGDYDYIVLIDSIYFMGSFRSSLIKISQGLSSSGKMLISVFQSMGDEDSPAILLPDGTLLAQALRGWGFRYAWHDFTTDMRAHGIRGHRILEDLREIFQAEDNEFLYEARAEEISHFRELAEKERIVRYLYVVENRPST
jgi:2-polyprenyl-3-methyl-5-hydroxy-6-metoxy-1,4-benzoquinol methylase